MTQEEKDLVLRDLCARLPYGVICHIVDVQSEAEIDDILTTSTINNFDEWIVKPYLRPMSSMTGEEMTEYKKLSVLQPTNNGYDWHEVATIDALDWLLANHLDFMGLIDEGLAIDCTNLNIY